MPLYYVTRPQWINSQKSIPSLTPEELLSVCCEYLEKIDHINGAKNTLCYFSSLENTPVDVVIKFSGFYSVHSYIAQ